MNPQLRSALPWLLIPVLAVATLTILVDQPGASYQFALFIYVEIAVSVALSLILVQFVTKDRWAQLAAGLGGIGLLIVFGIDTWIATIRPSAPDGQDGIVVMMAPILVGVVLAAVVGYGLATCQLTTRMRRTGRSFLRLFLLVIPFLLFTFWASSAVFSGLDEARAEQRLEQRCIDTYADVAAIQISYPEADVRGSSVAQECAAAVAFDAVAADGRLDTFYEEADRSGDSWGEHDAD